MTHIFGEKEECRASQCGWSDLHEQCRFYCWKTEDVQIWRGDLISWFYTDVVNCEDECLDDETCNAFTFDENTNRCEIYREVYAMNQVIKVNVD